MPKGQRGKLQLRGHGGKAHSSLGSSFPSGTRRLLGFGTLSRGRAVLRMELHKQPSFANTGRGKGPGRRPSLWNGIGVNFSLSLGFVRH